jgi:hypothetical protein
MSEHVINDGDNVNQAFPRACAGCQYVIVACTGDMEGFSLVCIEAESLPVSCISGGILVFEKDFATFVVKHTVFDEHINPRAGLKRGIKLDQRIRPEESSLKLLLDLIAQPRILDMKESANEIPIVADQSIAEFKHIHLSSLRYNLPFLSIPVAVNVGEYPENSPNELGPILSLILPVY